MNCSSYQLTVEIDCIWNNHGFTPLSKNHVLIHAMQFKLSTLFKNEEKQGSMQIYTCMTKVIYLGDTGSEFATTYRNMAELGAKEPCPFVSIEFLC